MLYNPLLPLWPDACSFHRLTTVSTSQTLAENCLTCTRIECARHVNGTIEAGKTAFLLDEYQPEFSRLVRDRIRHGDRVLLPFLTRNDLISTLDEGWRNTRVAT
jgi:hypothetical protein